MNPKIKERWVEALRSGKYKQGKGNLRHRERTAGINQYEDTYCCLGVLCDILHPDGWVEEDARFYMYYENKVLPHTIREEAGLIARNPDVEIAGGFKSLASLNDQRFTFDQIADLIEEKF